MARRDKLRRRDIWELAPGIWGFDLGGAGDIDPEIWRGDGVLGEILGHVAHSIELERLTQSGIPLDSPEAIDRLANPDVTLDDIVRLAVREGLK